MTVNVLFFAKLREITGVNSYTLNLESQQSVSVEILITLLPKPLNTLSNVAISDLRCAINQKMATLSNMVYDGDEVAFFPPVTGG